MYGPGTIGSRDHTVRTGRSVQILVPQNTDRTVRTNFSTTKIFSVQLYLTEDRQRIATAVHKRARFVVVLSVEFAELHLIRDLEPRTPPSTGSICASRRAHGCWLPVLACPCRFCCACCWRGEAGPAGRACCWRAVHRACAQGMLLAGRGQGMLLAGAVLEMLQLTFVCMVSR